MPAGPFGGPRPLANTQEVWFNTSLTIPVPKETEFKFDKYRSSISKFLNLLLQQQPELDLAGGTLYVYEPFLGSTAEGSQVTNLDRSDIVNILYGVEIDMRMEEPVLVFSHVSDAQSVLRDTVIEPSDSRVLPKGRLRDERDSDMQAGNISFSLPLSSI